MAAIKQVRISTYDGNTSGWPGRIEDAETGKQIPGVGDISVNWTLGEVPIATLEIKQVALNIVANANFVPVPPGLCASCRWWGVDEDAHPLKYMDESNTDPKRDTYRPCAMTSFEGGYKHGESLAFSTDAEQYKPQLFTAPNFGCVQWEPKDADS